MKLSLLGETFEQIFSGFLHIQTLKRIGEAYAGGPKANS
jgi:hypothetical protein